MPITACKNEGNATLSQNLNHGSNRVAVQIDVKDGKIELSLPCELDGLADIAGLCCNTVAEVCQHAFEQHANHYFVLDHEDALTRARLSAVSHRDPVPAPQRWALPFGSSPQTAFE